MKRRKPYRKSRKADYQGATPRQVAEAVLRYRGHGKPVRHIREKPEDAPPEQVNGATPISTFGP